MKKFLILLSIITTTISVKAQRVEPIETLNKIKEEAFNNSKIEELSFWFTDYMGPRLSCSDMYFRAENIAKAIFDSIGLEQIVSEEVGKFDFEGWDYDKMLHCNDKTVLCQLHLATCSMVWLDQGQNFRSGYLSECKR